MHTRRRCRCLSVKKRVGSVGVPDVMGLHTKNPNPHLPPQGSVLFASSSRFDDIIEVMMVLMSAPDNGDVAVRRVFVTLGHPDTV